MVLTKLPNSFDYFSGFSLIYFNIKLLITPKCISNMK